MVDVRIGEYSGDGFWWNDRCYFEESDVREDNGGKWPYDVFGVYRYAIKLNPASIVDDLEHDDAAFEDYEVDEQGVAEIEDFCEKWNAKYAQYSYYKNKHVRVIE